VPGNWKKTTEEGADGWGRRNTGRGQLGKVTWKKKKCKEKKKVKGKTRETSGGHNKYGKGATNTGGSHKPKKGCWTGGKEVKEGKTLSKQKTTGGGGGGGGGGWEHSRLEITLTKMMDADNYRGGGFITHRGRKKWKQRK